MFPQQSVTEQYMELYEYLNRITPADEAAELPPEGDRLPQGPVLRLNPVAEFGSADCAEGRDLDRVRGFGAEGHPVCVYCHRGDGRGGRRFIDLE